VRLKNFLKGVGKNALVILFGAIVGSIVLFVYLFYFWLPLNSARIGLGVIAYIPVLLIFSLIIGSIAGGIIALVIRLIVKRFH